ncbi:hypothetical protein M9H77_07985 [Catharanthus roseus]|uniref:Uncharacterized protein n=1 Tax=Catharanthus roseus TaxID=4058 RepID=A0ACC0BWJ2_CATRO|nr:hypothetical protein M9H77_07985 [Catharanthus roseus]
MPCTRPTGPVDLQLGSSFVDELLSGFTDVSPYSNQHMDYYDSSRHVPSYTLGSGEHSGDEGSKEAGDDLEDEAEQGEGDEEVDMGVVGRLSWFLQLRSSVGKKKAKKGDDDSWMQRGLAPGGPGDPKVMPSYGGHVTAVIWRGEVHSYGLYSATGDDADLPMDIRASCYVLSMIGNSIFTNNSGLNTWIYLYFPMFASPMRAGAVGHNPYIQQFELLGTTRGGFVLEYCMRLDTIRAVKVRWTLYMLKR